MTQNLAVKQETIPSISPDDLISKAIDKGISVEGLERLLAMRERIKAEQAREAYFSALSGFQHECPIIEKTREVKDRGGGVRYRYASLDDIVSKVSPLLAKYGLSYTIKTESQRGSEGAGFIIATTEVHHVHGHTEISSFPVPIETEAFMNEAQKAGSAMAYAKRYSFCNALGILTGDQDDDGESLGSGITIQSLYANFAITMQCVLDNLESIATIKEAITSGSYSSGAEAWFELPDEVKKMLWVAPTKGGVFTTEERDVIKKKEWRESHFGSSAPTLKDALSAVSEGDIDLARDIAGNLTDLERDEVNEAIAKDAKKERAK